MRNKPVIYLIGAADTSMQAHIESLLHPEFQVVWDQEGPLERAKTMLSVARAGIFLQGFRDRMRDGVALAYAENLGVPVIGVGLGISLDLLRLLMVRLPLGEAVSLLKKHFLLPDERVEPDPASAVKLKLAV